MQLLSTLALASVATNALVAPVARKPTMARSSISDTESEIVAVEPVAAEPEPVIVAPTPVAAPPRGWDVSLDMQAGIAR